MILALDDDVPARRRGRRSATRTRSWTCGRSASAASADDRPDGGDPSSLDPRPARRDARPRPARRVRSSSSRAGSRGRPRHRCPPTGRRQAALVARAAGAPARPAGAARARWVRCSRSSIRRCGERPQTAEAIVDAHRRGAADPRGRGRASSRSARASGRACTATRSTARYGGRPRRLATRRRPDVGARRRVARRGPGPGPAGPGGGPRPARRGRDAGNPRSLPGRRATATDRRPIRGRSSSATTACSRSRC